MEKLSNKERKYIISELLNTLSSTKYGGGDVNLKDLEKLDDESFDIKQREFEMIKSVCLKLKGDTA